MCPPEYRLRPRQTRMPTATTDIVSVDALVTPSIAAVVPLAAAKPDLS